MSQVLIRRKPQTIYTFFAICPGGLDEVLKKEIADLPATITHHYPGGVEFEGPIETAYLACLQLRTASRVLLRLKQTKKIFKDEELYEAVHSVDWTEVFDVDSTFSVYFTETRTKDRRGKTNTQYLALKAKDAIVDRFRKKYDRRPNVSRDNPDATIRLHWHDHILKIYLDLSGRSLHERGYRKETLEAPIKENLAAGLLLLADWPRLAAEKVPFLDPFCGSGTLLIEAALIATHTAPGLYRTQFGFYSWKDHQPDLFDSILERLKAKRVLDPTALPTLSGSDQSAEAIAATRANLANAGLQSLATLQVARFEDTRATTPTGIIVTNPPYGVRLNEIDLLIETYNKLGSTLKHHYSGWQCGVISSEKKLLAAIGLRPRKKFNLHNGGLDSILSLFDLYKGEKVAK